MARARAPQASVSAAPLPDAALFDTFSLVFRAYYALPPLSNAQGEPTSALYGFAGLVLKVLREQRPRRLSFALDAPARTFRSERYPAYKAGRPSTPSDLLGSSRACRNCSRRSERPFFVRRGSRRTTCSRRWPSAWAPRTSARCS